MVLTWKSIVALIIILGILFVIISENRHPVKTLAWCMILIFMPVVGIVLYVLFGMDNRHRKQIKAEELDHLKDEVIKTQGGDVSHDVSEKYGSLVKMLYNADRAYPLGGNKVEVFTEFSSMSDSLVRDIEGARHHVHILFFKFENDAAGKRITTATIRFNQFTLYE